MDKQEKYALGYEVDQLAKESPIMKLIIQMETNETITPEFAYDFYSLEWSRCVDLVAKKHGIAEDDTDRVWEAFNDYNDD